MKTLKKSIALLSLSTAVFISSCKQTQMLPLSLTGHDGLRISSASLSGIKGEVNVKIKNPNPKDVSVYRSKLNIKINNIPVGKAQIKSRLVIPANSEVEEVLYLKSDFSHLGYFDIPKVIKTVQSQNMNLSINGNLKSGRFFNKTYIPVSMKDTINVKEKTRSALTFISKIGKKSARFFTKSGAENKTKN